MAKAKAASTTNQKDSLPKTLDDHIFFGLTLDDEQKAFRDAIYDPSNLIIFCDAKAGTGKTLVAVATGYLMAEAGMYDGITYVVNPTQENKQGFLPGDQSQKNEPYAQPLYDALYAIDRVQDTSPGKDILSQKNGKDMIDFITPTYKRGTNIRNRFVIIEEAQNFPFAELKKMLTRIHDTSKCVVIGHHMQCDLIRNQNAFEKYIKHFEDRDFCKVCTLSTNHRGKVSTWADELEE